MDDSKIIELFFERSEQAIIELSKKYGSICNRVANNILNNRLDSEECERRLFRRFGTQYRLKNRIRY